MAIREFKQPKAAPQSPEASTIKTSRGVKAHEDAFVLQPYFKETKSKVENVAKSYERIATSTLIRWLDFQNFRTERSLQVWGVPFKTQIMATQIPADLSAKCHLPKIFNSQFHQRLRVREHSRIGDQHINIHSLLNEIKAIIFNVKISRNIVLEYTFVPKVIHGIDDDEYLVRKIRLLRPQDWDKMEGKGYSYLSIDQCPHSFLPEMVEHCEVHHSEKGWTSITDATMIYNLLEDCAQMLHRLEKLPTHPELCRCSFSRTTKEKDLIASGQLGVVDGSLAKSTTPPMMRTIDGWLEDVSTYHKYFDEVEQRATKQRLKYRNEDFEEPPSIDWEFYLTEALKHNPATGYHKYFLGKRPKRSTKPKPRQIHPRIMVFEPSADPTVIIIGAKSAKQAKPMVKKIRFSEATKLWLDPRASKKCTSRYVPQRLNEVPAGMHLLEQYTLMDPKMTSEHIFDSKLTIYLGPLASPVCERFDNLLERDVKELERRDFTETDGFCAAKSRNEVYFEDSIFSVVSGVRDWRWTDI